MQGLRRPPGCDLWFVGRESVPSWVGTLPIKTAGARLAYHTRSGWVVPENEQVWVCETEENRVHVHDIPEALRLYSRPDGTPIVPPARMGATG